MLQKTRREAELIVGKPIPTKYTKLLVKGQMPGGPTGLTTYAFCNTCCMTEAEFEGNPLMYKDTKVITVMGQTKEIPNDEKEYHTVYTII